MIKRKKIKISLSLHFLKHLYIRAKLCRIEISRSAGEMAAVLRLSGISGIPD
jgi:hypothetical protein